MNDPSAATAAPAPVEPARFEGEGGSSSWMSPAWVEADAPPRAATSKIEFDDRTQLNAAARAIGGHGVMGRMADLVAFQDGYEQVGKRLLGATVVVDDLDRAMKLHQAGVGDRLVTLDGDVVDEDGVVAGGSRDAQGAGVLAQKREIRDLGDIVGQLEHDLAEATARLVTAKTELKQVGKALDGLRSQVHEGEVAIMGHEKDESRVRARARSSSRSARPARHRAARARESPRKRSRPTTSPRASARASRPSASRRSSARRSISWRTSRSIAIGSTS